jgi:CheY-like chemotaxis protein
MNLTRDLAPSMLIPGCPDVAKFMQKVLIVDDDAESRNLLCEVLEANGYLTDAVGDGLAAREALGKDEDIQLVIADLQMPNENGLCLLRHLRRQNAKHDIILMSSFISATERETARQLGVETLLEKPFKLSDLLQAVARLTAKGPTFVV